jgi:UPF0755 protein
LRRFLLLIILAGIGLSIWGGVSFHQINSAMLKGDTRLFTVKKGIKARELIPELTQADVSPFWTLIC